jgi:hypothetical protein
MHDDRVGVFRFFFLVDLRRAAGVRCVVNTLAAAADKAATAATVAKLGFYLLVRGSHK